jgi:NADH-quinone oxidoreductase subunit G
VDGEALTDAHGRAGYLFNSTIAGLDEADAILLIGTNPRTDAAVLSARMNLRWRNTDLKIGVVGPADNTPYEYEHIGTGAKDLAGLIDGSHPFAKILRDAKRPMVIVGSAATGRPDGAAVYAAAARIASDAAAGADAGWHTFNVLHTAAGRAGAMDLGFLPPAGSTIPSALDMLFLLSCDSERFANAGAGFIVYVGTHGDLGAHKADVILPGAAYTEKSATFVNTEGRPQITAKAAFAPGDAREDWKIIRALSDKVGQTLPYDDLGGLRAAMYAAAPHLAQIGHIAAPAQAKPGTSGADIGQLTDAPFTPALADFYLSNPIARASAVMAELSALRQATAKRAEAAE